jgi:hypothetical protein
MNAIDPKHRMNRVASEATEGAIAGGIGAAGASALGASAAMGPEVLAGASAYIAGAESGRAITNALVRGGMDEDAAEGVGSVSGGAIGGVTAAGVGAGATIAGSVAFGAEVGDAIGIVGGPIGMAIGTAVGATIGAAIGGIGYLFSHVGGHDEPAQPTAARLAYEQVLHEQATAGVAGRIRIPATASAPARTITIGNRAMAAAAARAGPAQQAARMHAILQHPPPP